MSQSTRNLVVIVLSGSLILFIAFGIRSAFGLFLQPMSADLGWGREVFALAMAIQNLVWGAMQPVAGMIADRFGAARTLAVFTLLYFLGLLLMAATSEPWTFHLSAGLLIGIGLAGCSFGVVLGAVGRAVDEKYRSLALGIGTALGSAGQFAMVLIGQELLSAFGWQNAFLILAAIVLVMLPLAFGLRSATPVADHAETQSLGAAIGEARRHGGFLLLTAGFFVCGFHLAFIAVHLPAYLVDAGLPAATGAWALALVGLANIVGSFAAGIAGGRYSKKYCLSLIYLARSAVIIAYIALPITTLSTMLFAVGMGLLWLSTVPLTSGLVAQIFGPRYMSTLFGFVFFSHQVGSFLGVWLGGYFYDTTGSYDGVWWISIGLGVAAALLHWPIDDRSVRNVAEAPGRA
ncbi:MFS transporter [Oceanibacterium hippocampi]|uniref:Putative MFS-type transporter YhjX n=1 Tax=Oceanibacterium hippocampi TaxID=745714 RepID=A0A1Y5SSV3_9PROT|nr:MFS transporter [Oceanibacterium hippocampi]SLN44449.1 putative MFS-type transporter YhjX [Oceanibacterium hippocampi]